MDQRKSKAKQALSGTLLAVAAAQLFLSAPSMTGAAEGNEAKVHCTGPNACKGKSECSSARNSCSGQNACKGQGWASMSEKQCLAKGGKPDKG